MSPLRSISDQLAIHARTPALVVSDPRGLAVRTVGYYRREADTPAEPRVSAQWHDHAGRPVAQWDPRQFEHFQSGASETPNQATVFSLSGTPLQQNNVDSGWKVMLDDADGLSRESWDSRRTHTCATYDRFSRLESVHQRVASGEYRTLQRLSYSSVDPDQATLNRCGAAWRQDDDAGTLLFNGYALSGSSMSTTRRFHMNDNLADWPEDMGERDALLEPGEGYLSSVTENACGELVSATDAAGNTHFLKHDVSGHVCSGKLTLVDGAEHELMRASETDAQGRIVVQTNGNGVTSRSEYSADGSRLIRLHSNREDGTQLQDLSYGYDPVGNILESNDASQPVRHFANQRTEPSNRYGYDSFSRLIVATGREVATAGAPSPALPGLQPLPEDPGLLLNYSQTYAYDPSGNMVQMRHVNGQNNYTRSMAVARFSNRTLPESNGHLPDEAQLNAGFDPNGNLHALQAGQSLGWDSNNQLSHFSTVVRADGDDYERYFYDAAGTRVRKVTVTRSTRAAQTKEVRYLPGLEIRTDSHNDEVLHVVCVQNGHCKTRLLHWESGKPTDLANDRLRLSLDNHLGSSTMELDGDGQLLSREEYYPFGGTACWAGRNALEAKYKTVRYSGKERDASGLYYYGLRYYAPWIQRWINPDPSGDIDGLNLYRMVSNNPINLVDLDGGVGEEAPRGKKNVADTFRNDALSFGGMINSLGTSAGSRKRMEVDQRTSRDQARTLAQNQLERKTTLLLSMLELTQQSTHSTDMAFASMQDSKALAKAIAFRASAITLSNLASTGVGLAVGVLTAPAGPAVAIPAGLIAGKLTSIGVDKALESAGNPTALNVHSGDLNPHSIKHSGLYRKHSLLGKAAYKFRSFLPDGKKYATNLAVETVKTGGSKLAGPAGVLVKIGVDSVKAGLEVASALKGKDLDKVQKVEDNGAALIRELYARTEEVIVGLARNSNDPNEELMAGLTGPITVGHLLDRLGNAIGSIEHTRSLAADYRRSQAA